MCDGPLYDIVRHDSQNAAHLGNMIGGKFGQFMQQEGETNQKNPGRALTKAAISAASWYLGSAAGQYLGSGADAGGTAADVSTSDLGALGTVGGEGSNLAAQQALQYAGGLDPETQAGLGGMSVAQNGIGPGSLLNQFRGTISNPSSLTSSNGLLGNLVAGSNTGKAGNLALQMGLKSMAPQPQQGPQPMPPPQQQPSQPLPLPYNNSLLAGKSSVSNSLPPPGMSYAEWIRRKQMGGY